MYRTLYSPQGGRIILDGREVINMASNNSLGLANHPAVVAAAKEALEKYGVATTASRNICGNYPVHDELEEKLAKFKGVEATLVFNCGVTANSGLIPQLVGKGDFIYSDELNHGSIIDGCRLSGAKIKVPPHGYGTSGRAAAGACRRQTAHHHRRRIQHGRRPCPPA